MADFMTNLWSAIFEAGPTPTLLLATNATFAALQALLFALLIATYSYHFVILSTLCAALWVSINWFAAELRNVQAEQEQMSHSRANQDDKANHDSHPAETDGHMAPVDKSQQVTTSAASIASLQDDGARQRTHQDVPTSADNSFDSDWEQVER